LQATDCRLLPLTPSSLAYTLRHFSKSSKRTNQYKACAQAAGLSVLVPQRIVPTRWLSAVAPLSRLAK